MTRLPTPAARAVSRVVSGASERIAAVTLTEFLLARIAEDEATARAAVRAGYPGPLKLMARTPFRPAHVLAECEAKRRIVEIASPYVDEHGREETGGGVPDILRALALPYADHPDYRPEWRP